jgi:hypothetical protein
MIADLADHPRFIPLLADAFAREWQDWASSTPRRGWRVFRRVDYEGRPMALLRKKINGVRVN